MIEIFFSCDRNYVQHTTVAIVSMLEHTDCQAIRLYILDGGLLDAQKETIASELQRYGVVPHFVTPDLNLYEKFQVSRHVTAATYYRLSIPYLLPPDSSKAIYLDSDVIVQDDISLLWKLDLGNYAALAVIEPFWDRSEELNLPAQSPYFNAGVLVINVQYWRENNIPQKAFEFIQAYPEKLLCFDQDALNNVLYNCWKPIAARWNVTSDFFKANKKINFNDEYFRGAASNPAIVHFTTSAKPWVYAVRHPYKSAYYRYLAKTSIKSEIPQNKSIIKFLRRTAGYFLDFLKSSKS